MEILEAHGVDTTSSTTSTRASGTSRPTPHHHHALGEVRNGKRLLYVGNEDDGGDVVMPNTY